MNYLAFPGAFASDPKAGGFVVTFRDVPVAITQAENVADAVSQSTDCLDEAIAGRIRLGEAIPRPSRIRKGERLIGLSALMAAKTALYVAMKEAGLSRVQLAKRLQCHEKEVRRLLDPRHKSRIGRIEAAMRILGRELLVGYRAA